MPVMRGDDDTQVLSHALCWTRFDMIMDSKVPKAGAEAQR
jgi:hypothetical protein